MAKIAEAGLGIVNILSVYFSYLSGLMFMTTLAKGMSGSMYNSLEKSEKLVFI